MADKATSDWFEPTRGGPDWSQAVRHLRKVDPVLREHVDRIGPCTLAPHPDAFRTLVLSVYNQQLSMKGAATLFRRFEEKLGGGVSPERVLDALSGDAAWPDETIRHCGLSRQKRTYLIDMARHVLDGRLRFDRLAEMDDEQAIRRLTAVKGVGVWTAQMHLMFVLCRPDVLPTLDLGLQEAARRVYGLPQRPRPKELEELARPWRPWCTVAAWYLWRTKDT
jgi:DNA-3-methyladenine glycosylase II